MRIPTSTYRLQINADFPFARVRALIDYFRDLGVGDLYFAPVFQARPKSPHGYDVTNPAQFNREVGDEPEFEALSRALRDEGMGVLLDIVPNHMAASEENPWWRDVLEHGRASFASDFFDVEWDAPHCGSRLILPVLGREFDEAMEDGEIGIALSNGELLMTYAGRTFPLDPATYGMVLRKIEGMDPGIIAAAEAIGPRQPGPLQQREQRRLATLELKKRLVEFPTVDAPVLSKEEMRALIDKQAYRPEFWRSGTRRINYRRFFDITDLAGVRIEDPDVFATTHSLILTLIRDQLITGVRVDHVDGLRDPGGYLNDLRAAIGSAYVVVEKILAHKEELRDSWPVEGSTGYDFVGLLAGLFCEPEGLARMTTSYEQCTGLPPFEEIVYEKKKLVIEALFAGEMLALATQFRRLSEEAGSPIQQDVAAACVTEVSAFLPVYRTYIGEEVDGYDRCVVKNAITAARHRAHAVPDAAYALLRNLLLGDGIPGKCAKLRTEFIASWQQFTGPVMAKSMEDTAFYTYNRLIALSEVGAHPDAIVASTSEFHELIANRGRKWPYTMNASSTHDTKRSEDVRARLLVLSEMPDVWDQAVGRWNALTENHRTDVAERRFPEINEQLLIYQTLLGVWPLKASERASLPDRLHGFLQKAAREAKTHSSWLDPNEEYEKALFDYTDALLADGRFLEDFAPLRDTVAWYGALNSLSQLTIKLCAPGVPDIYQGNETWTYGLVDPDNRRPVDFDALAKTLRSLPENITASAATRMLHDWKDGRIKMHVTRTGTRLRRAKPHLFANGEYIGLRKHGKHARNVIPFMRHFGDEWLLVLTGRFYSQLGPRPVGNAWADTTVDLPAGAPREWRNVLTGEVTEGTSMEEVFATLPFAILTCV